MSLAEAALAHAYRGWPVFPCRARGKEPLVAGGFKAASTDEAQVRAWWKQWPQANIGYPTGSLVVVEIDGPEGAASMAALRADHSWPETLTAMSGRPGLHCYFLAPAQPIRNAAGLRGSRGLGHGIDVRGAGGYVILPPSVHPTGRRYAWVSRVAPAPMPAWMVERLRPAPVVTVPPRTFTNAEAYSRYAEAALNAEVEAVETAPAGTLNDTLNRAAYSLGRLVPDLSEGTISDELLAAALRNGHPERGARNTIRSGLTAGMARRR